MTSTYYRTTNRCQVGDRVYCYGDNTFGTIVATDTLNLDYAPVVSIPGGMRLFVGTNLKNYCQHIELFMTALEELGWNTEQIATFRDSWFANTNRDSTRQPLWDALKSARDSGDSTAVQAAIDDAKSAIGLS